MGNKKGRKLNIFIYFFVMLLAYLLFEFLSGIIPKALLYSVRFGKYGLHFTSELCWLIFVLFVIIISDNMKMFGEKREKFFKTLIIGAPILVFTIIYTMGNIKELLSANAYDALSLVIYCLAIGFTEEFMCRGWILNQFLKRYGDNRKTVLLSIIFSALIFGGMHITNIWNAGQTVPETIIQIIFATAAGIFFGALYFRTKNILAIGFLHGFYDFSIMIGDLNYLRDCTSNTITKVIMFSLILNIVLAVIYVLSALVIIRKSKTYEYLNEEIDEKAINKDNNFKTIATACSIGVYIATISFVPALLGLNEKDYDKASTCYEYKEINLQYVDTSYNNRDYYNLSDKIVIKLEDNKLNIYLDNKKYNVDKKVAGMFVIDNKDTYIVTYHKYEDNSDDSIFYYLKINKDSIVEEDKKIEELIKSFREYKLPMIATIGSVKETDDDYNYPLIKDYNDNLFMIDNKDVIRNIVLDTKKESDLKSVRLEKENKKLAKELIEYVPFINFKDIQYTDVYRGVNSKLEELDKEVLYSYAYRKSKSEILDLLLDLSICKEIGPCTGNLYVKNEELSNNLLNMYGLDIDTSTLFNIENGRVEFNSDYWVYIKETDDETITKMSKVIKYERKGDDFIIEEVAGFIYGNTLSKFSDIDNSVIQVNEDLESLKKYFNDNYKSFATFKHTFKYNKELKKYYYYETKISKE